MKRLLCLMAACLLIPCAVLAASPADDAVAYASICLTEVYGSAVSSTSKVKASASSAV